MSHISTLLLLLRHWCFFFQVPRQQGITGIYHDSNVQSFFHRFSLLFHFLKLKFAFSGTPFPRLPQAARLLLLPFVVSLRIPRVPTPIPSHLLLLCCRLPPPACTGLSYLSLLPPSSEGGCCFSSSSSSYLPGLSCKPPFKGERKRGIPLRRRLQPKVPTSLVVNTGSLRESPPCGLLHRCKTKGILFARILSCWTACVRASRCSCILSR